MNRRSWPVAISMFAILSLGMGCAHKISVKQQLSMSHRILIPDSYSEGYVEGASEPTRYVIAYEAYWWRCVETRIIAMSASCDHCTCSGTPASAAGCRDGCKDAGRKIDELVKQYGEDPVSLYLRSLMSSEERWNAVALFFNSYGIQKDFDSMIHNWEVDESGTDDEGSN